MILFKVRMISYSHGINAFSEPLNIVTDLQYAEMDVSHIETADFISENT